MQSISRVIPRSAPRFSLRPSNICRTLTTVRQCQTSGTPCSGSGCNKSIRGSPPASMSVNLMHATALATGPYSTGTIMATSHTPSNSLLRDVKAKEEARADAINAEDNGSTGSTDVSGRGINVIEGGIGSEGPSKSSLKPPVSVTATEESTVVAATTTLSHITGPWTNPPPPYTPTDLQSIQVLHRPPQDLSDRLARNAVRLARWGFDFVTGYKHKEIPTAGANGKGELSLEELRKGGYILTPGQWLDRALFLESIAGVPGMVGGVLRHLRSLRLMRRDGGWIHTLLSEAENERMHLLTFMTVEQPTWLFRAMVLGAQGVFFNLFFLTYLISPRTAHRFVGHLEEEACLTYTRLLDDMHVGRLPEWDGVPAPEIAIDYWHLAPDAKMIDVIYAVRADEAGHRIVNHTLANLDQKNDFNPFALKEVDMRDLGAKVELTREEASEYARRCHEEALAANANAKQGAALQQVSPQA